MQRIGTTVICICKAQDIVFKHAHTHTPYIYIHVFLQCWYVTISLNKQYAVDWIKQVKQVLVLICKQLVALKVGVCFVGMATTGVPYYLTHHSLLLTPHSTLTHHSSPSLLTHHSTLTSHSSLHPHSSHLTHHSSLLSLTPLFPSQGNPEMMLLSPLVSTW